MKRAPSVEQIIDPAIGLNYDVSKMEILVKVALDCVQEDKDARPTMSKVVEMLHSHESDPRDRVTLTKSKSLGLLSSIKQKFKWNKAYTMRF